MAATSIQIHLSGETVILVFYQGLWLGPSLQCLLLNPNQLNHHGLTVNDSPFDANGVFIEIDDKNLPLKCQGTTILFESWTQTQQELKNCPYITLTSDSK